MPTTIPLNPPREWFTPPENMPKDAGCVVEDSGRIYGYLCHWGSVLMDGTNDRWKPPRSKTEYAYAHTGDTVCDDDSVIRTANLGGDAGHAPSSRRVEDLQAFYENTSTQLARVRYGEDQHGVWFAGACWPTVSELDIARLRASARSGHWAAVGDWKDLSSGRSGYELVGACLVNVPGLKYARADRAASGVMMLTPMKGLDNYSLNRVDDNALRLLADFVSEYTKSLMLISEPDTTTEVEHSVACSGTATFEPSTGTEIEVSGILVVEDQNTEDGRLISAGGVEWRELPLPLYAKLENTPGHDDAMLVGRLDKIWRDPEDNARIRYSGVIIPESASEYGQNVLDAINNKTLKGISIDGITGPNDVYIDDSETMVMSRIVVAGATLTPMPAIGDATVTIGKDDTSEEFSVSDNKDFQGDDTSTDETAVDGAQAAAADGDQMDAMRESLNAVSDRLEYLISLIEASEMNARYEAAARRAS